MSKLPACALAAGVVLLAVSCSSAPVSGAGNITPGRCFAERLPDLGINNAARINPALYRGAQPSHDGFLALKRAGVKTIINLRAGYSERKEVEALGFKSVEIPLRADAMTSRAPTKEQIQEFLEVVKDPANQPVFFHCHKGRDRAGTMCAIYRMEVDGWKNEEALEEMRSFDFAEFYKNLLHCVRDYKCSETPGVAVTGVAAGG